LGRDTEPDITAGMASASSFMRTDLGMKPAAPYVITS
jgi:hypothetical protein